MDSISPLKMEITPPLFPFQKDAITKMCEFLQSSPGKAAYNACEPGLGKTRMAIETCHRMCFNKILVITPAIMRLTWKTEFSGWGHFDWKEVHPILTNKDFLKLTKTTNICIVSYDLVSREDAYKEILAFSWDCLILDESHYLKTPKAKRTKIILDKIWPKIPHRIALSGTPFLSSITDVYPVFDRMLPDTFGSFDQFGKKFANPSYTPWGIKYNGVKNAKLLTTVIQKYFFIRYKKQEVLPDLPTKIFQKISLPDSASVKAYEEELKKLLASSNGSLDFSKLEKIPDHLAGLRRLQGKLKVTRISEYVKELLDQEIPIVLFAYHRDVLDDYMKELKDYKPVLIKGDTSAKERQRAVDTFQHGGTNLFIGQIQASGVGITLTRGSHCVMAELDWSPAIVSQAVDRLNRIGQKNTVNVHYFVVDNSIDERISTIIVNKARTFSQVLQ